MKKSATKRHGKSWSHYNLPACFLFNLWAVTTYLSVKTFISLVSASRFDKKTKRKSKSLFLEFTPLTLENYCSSSSHPVEKRAKTSFSFRKDTCIQFEMRYNKYSFLISKCLFWVRVIFDLYLKSHKNARIADESSA